MYIAMYNSFVKVIEGAEATCVKIATEIKKSSRLKEMSNFNVLGSFQPI